MNLKLMALTVRTFFYHPVQECAKVADLKKRLTRSKPLGFPLLVLQHFDSSDSSFYSLLTPFFFIFPRLLLLLIHATAASLSLSLSLSFSFGL